MSRDKKIIIGIIFGFIWFSIMSWFPSPEAKDIVRTIFGVVLCIFLYKGYNWSRWVMGVLSALAAIVAALSILAATGSFQTVVIFGLMLCFYCYAAVYLLNPKALRSHFNRVDA